MIPCLLFKLDHCYHFCDRFRALPETGCKSYVILHELCHLKEHNHGNVFYDLLTALIADWEKRKEKLDLKAERRSL